MFYEIIIYKSDYFDDNRLLHGNSNKKEIFQLIMYSNANSELHVCIIEGCDDAALLFQLGFVVDQKFNGQDNSK